MKFYTIGYGDRKPEDFMNLLKQKGIKAVVDVRLRPDRARLGSYKKAKTADKGIQRFLGDENIEYVSFIELGNPFMDCTDWRERYQRLLDKAGDILFERFNEHIQRLSAPFSLMCAEKEVSKCHRQLVAGYLVNKGFEVEHIE